MRLSRQLADFETNGCLKHTKCNQGVFVTEESGKNVEHGIPRVTKFFEYLSRRRARVMSALDRTNILDKRTESQFPARRRRC